MATPRQILLYYAHKYNNEWDKIFNAIDSKEKCDLKEGVEYVPKGVNALTLLDNDFPNYLKSITKPPFVIYYKGDISLIKDNNNLLYLDGENKFKIPSKNLVVFDIETKHIKIGDTLEVWTNNVPTLNRVLGVQIANKYLLTRYIFDDTECYMPDGLFYALATNKRTFVVPTTDRSSNNKYIKSGADLADSLEDLELNQDQDKSIIDSQNGGKE